MKLNINFTKEELENEIWLPIPNYEDLYEASSLGRIRTKEGKTTFTKKHGERHWEQRILKIKFCQSSKKKDRIDGRVELWKDGKHKTYLVARLVMGSFDKSYDIHDKTITVNHIDGVSTNNKIENLEWCTRKENIQKGFVNNLYKSKRVKVINKETGEETLFYSMEAAGRFLSPNRHGYICDKMTRKTNKFENSHFRWVILN
jgi:hypothetical protein